MCCFTLAGKVYVRFRLCQVCTVVFFRLPDCIQAAEKSPPASLPLDNTITKEDGSTMYEERNNRHSKPVRLRSKQIVIRLTEEEYESVKMKIEQSKMKQQDYLIKALTNKPIVVIEGVHELIPELKRIGNNLNQLTRACHEGKANCKSEVSEIEKELGDVWLLLRRSIQGQV